MKTIHIFLIFMGLALVQLFIPFQMILSKESVLNEGVPYKFKTRPVDPTDPFRGKYIVLNYELRSAQTNDTLWSRNDDIYIKLKKDSLGFAIADEVNRSSYSELDDYVRAQVTWYNPSNETVNFNLDFDRYYMEESKAYDAEITSVAVLRDSLPENDTYAVVYIKNGKAVLADVMIDEMSIKDYVEKE